MSGAVGNLFTASMFRLDGLNIQNVFIVFNTFCILVWRENTMRMIFNDIYFHRRNKAVYTGEVLGMDGALGGVGAKKIPPERDILI
ncbi:hypothetical protein [Rosenbergiella australiborealis]|nr:hypothetical protein [Rosenbergiella australiborealis]